MIIYGYDCDKTLEVSGGPVTLESIENEFKAGNLVGIFGNWSYAIQSWPKWWEIISFLYFQEDSPTGEKDYFMWRIKSTVMATDYVMVGNDARKMPEEYDDKAAAERSGWRFLSETEFAEGKR